MKAVTPHLYSRNHHFYYRVCVPDLLKPFYEKKEIVVSLGTKDLTEAKAKASSLDLELFTLLKQLETHRANPELNFKTSRESVESFLTLATPNYGKRKTSASVSPPSTKNSTPIHKESFSILYRQYLEICRDNSPKTLEAKRCTYALFQDHFGDLPIYKIGRSQAREFQTRLMETTTRSNRCHTGYQSPPTKQLSTRTINVRLTCMNGLFKWIEEASDYKIGNPFAALQLKEGKNQPENPRRPFTKGEAKAFFSSPLYTGSKGENWSDRFTTGSHIIHDSLYWVPLIAYLSGMRLGEICQLYIDDIGNLDGVWYFDLNEREDKRLKTSSSRRKVPIHSRLITLGFIKFVQKQKSEGHKRVFTDVKAGSFGSYSYRFSKRFKRVLEKLELKQNDLCFHSFRHGFIDHLKEQGVERSIAMAICGHDRGGSSSHDFYGNGYSLRILSEAINKVPAPL